jgi:spore maturation protein A
MMLWCGLSAILHATGDDARLGRLLRRVLAPLFPGVEDDEAWGVMGLNIASNMLGLGNAATPYGVAAARLLTRPCMGQAGRDALAMLLVLNNAGLDFAPTTVITLRAAAGSAAPAAVWWPTLAASAAATVVGAGALVLIRKGEKQWKTRRHG